MKIKFSPPVIIIILIVVAVVLGSLIIGSFTFGTGPSQEYAGEMEVYPYMDSEYGIEDSMLMPEAAPGSKSSLDFTDYSTDRMIIKSASLTIEVTDFQKSYDSVIDLTQKANGFIADSSSYVTSSGNTRGDITIRVPEDEFNSVIEKIKQLGDLQSEHISGEDITEEYIDLNARLNNLERQEKRLLEILDLAETVEDILKVESELGRVRGEIEQIKGRINYLEDRVDLSTIRVHIYEPEPITHSWGMRDSLRMSVDGFITMINAIIILFGYLLPLLILYLIYRRVRSDLIPRFIKKGPDEVQKPKK